MIRKSFYFGPKQFFDYFYIQPFIVYLLLLEVDMVDLWKALIPGKFEIFCRALVLGEEAVAFENEIRLDCGFSICRMVNFLIISIILIMINDNRQNQNQNRCMLRQFLSVRHCNETNQINIYEAIHRRSKSSFQRLQKHKLLGKKVLTINDRVEKIKNKYGSYGNLQQRFIQCQSQQLTSINSNVTNKENQSTFINTSVNLNLNRFNNERRHIFQQFKVPQTQFGSKRKKKIKQQQRIHELEEINMKISMLIQSLKNDYRQQMQQQCQNKQNIEVQTFQPAQIISSNNLINKRQNVQIQKTVPNIIDFSSLNLTKFTNVQSKRSRIKTQQSVNTSKRSNKSSTSNPKVQCNQNQNSKSKSKSKRQNGKLTQPQIHSNQLKKSRKQLYNSLILLEENKQICFIKAFTKQIQLDQKFFKNKTRLMKTGKNFKTLLRNAVQTTQLSNQQKQIVLQFNFQDIDPLYTQRNSICKTKEKIDQNLLVYSVIDSFLSCQDHWKRKIYKKFNRKQINLSDLDIQDKGYFLKQDFTRFLSLKTRKMYYNRQINLIFRRINQRKSKIVSINQLINNLCI